MWQRICGETFYMFLMQFVQISFVNVQHGMMMINISTFNIMVAQVFVGDIFWLDCNVTMLNFCVCIYVPVVFFWTGMLKIILYQFGQNSDVSNICLK